MAAFVSLLLVVLAASAGAQTLPIGTWTGNVNIVPYTQSGSVYTCLGQCSNPAVAAPIAFLWSSNNLYINITAARDTRGCSLAAQSYSIGGIVVHQRYPYYGGTFYAPPHSFPVCFVFDNTGTFELVLDGQGNCPSIPTPPVCTQLGTQVAQTWTGSVKPIPSGLYRGSISILPYTNTGSGAQCLSQCSPITATSSLSFTYSTLRIDIGSGRSPQGCTLNAQTYYIADVVQHGAPNYYGGVLTVGKQTLPVCFYFAPNVGFVIMVDGLGTCPQSSSPATCYAGAQPGTVIQIWAGRYSTVDAKAHQLE